MSNSARLDGKLAVITGGGSGIGEASARIFAEAGARVVVTGRRIEPLQRVADEIGGHAIACDVSDQTQVRAMFAKALEITGKVDVLLNNAGGPGPIAPVSTVDMAEWVACMNTNLVGAMYALQEAARIMSAQKSGSIINMSSVAGLVGVPGTAAYAASKAGVRLFSKTVALETARENIRVNTIHPGMIWTDMQKVAIADNKEVFDQIVEAIPMGKMGEPDDIGAMVAFLASDDAKYVTGAELVVDGGMVAQ